MIGTASAVAESSGGVLGCILHKQSTVNCLEVEANCCRSSERASKLHILRAGRMERVALRSGFARAERAQVSR